MEYTARSCRQELHLSVHHKPVMLSRGCGVSVRKGDSTSLGCLNLWVRRTCEKDVEDTGKWRHKNPHYSQSGNIVLKIPVGDFWFESGEKWGLWARDTAPSCLEAVPFTSFVGERGGCWRNSWILYWFLLPTEMTATSKIWIFARKGKEKKVLKIDLFLSQFLLTFFSFWLVLDIINVVREWIFPCLLLLQIYLYSKGCGLLQRCSLLRCTLRKLLGLWTSNHLLRSICKHLWTKILYNSETILITQEPGEVF